MAFAEVHLGQDRVRPPTFLGGKRELEQEILAADLERGGVKLARPVFAPMPGGVQDAEARAAEALAVADPPGVFVGGREADPGGLNLAPALLVEPVQPVELFQLGGQQVAQSVAPAGHYLWP